MTKACDGHPISKEGRLQPQAPVTNPGQLLARRLNAESDLPPENANVQKQSSSGLPGRRPRSSGFLCMEGERITANLPPGECGSHNPLRVRELTPKPVSLMLVAKAVQGPTMARPKQLTSKHPRVLPSDKSACKHDEAVVEGVAHSATLIKD